MEKILPSNWVETNLKTVSNIIRGVTYKKDQALADKFANSFYILRGGNIQDGKIDFDTNDNVYVPNSLIHEVQEIQKYDVVIVGSTGSKKLIGKAGIAEENLENVSFGAFLMLMRTDNINKKFHSYFFKSHYYRTSISNLAGGVNINNIRKEHLENLTFPLPPLAEQERIVAKLDALFAQQEVMKKALSRIPDLLKDFRQQVLTQAVTGKLTESWRERRNLEVWRIEKLVDCTNNFDNVRVPVSQTVRNKRQGTYRYYGATGVVDYIDDYLFDGRYLLIGEDGANLLTKVKPLSFIVEGKFWVNNHAHVLQCKDYILMEFFNFYFNSISINDYVSGSAQPKLNQKNLNKISIPIAPLLEQQQIVSRVESLFAKADAIEERYKNLKEKVDTLPQAILHKAFKGELVEQLPTDGDANDLLKEIMKLKKEGKKK